MTKRARKRSTASQAASEGVRANGVHAGEKTTATGNGAAKAAVAPESPQPPERVSAETTAAAEPIPNILADPDQGAGGLRKDADLLARAVRERWPSTIDQRLALRRRVLLRALQTNDDRALAALARVDALMEQQNQRDEISQNAAAIAAAEEQGERETTIDPAAFDALARQFARSGATFVSVRSATVIAPQQPGGHGNGAVGG